MTETSDEESVEYIYESDADEDDDLYETENPANDRGLNSTNLVVDEEQPLMRPLLPFDTDEVDICNLFNH
jgi:hypothetical protein